MTRSINKDSRSIGGHVDRIYLASLAFCLLYVIPLFVVASNVAEFQQIDVNVTVLALLAVGVLGAIIGALLSAGIFAWKPARHLALALRFVFFACLLSGLVFPLAVSSGQVDLADIPINRLNLILTVAFAFLLTVVTTTRWHGLLFVVAMTVLIGNAISNTAIALTSILPKNSQSIYEASSGSNLFVLSFDGMPRDATLEVLEENPEIASAFRDFTAFDHVISSAPATATSIMAELTGISNFKEDYETEGQIYAEITSSAVFSNALDENGFKVSTYGTYASSFADKTRAFGYGTLISTASLITRMDQIAEILDYAFARAASWRAVFVRDLVRNSTAAYRSANDDLQARTANHKGRDWDIASILTLLDFERYSTELAVATDRPVAHFLHFTHTHFPVDFDAECRYRSDDGDWYWANQNRDGLKSQIRCALSQFAGFLTHLRAIGVYDNSLVVLKSDHGEPVAYNDPNRYEGFTVRGHENWGFGRYTPFLAIKAADAHRAALSVDQRHVALSDLATTLCRATIASAVDCRKYEGFDLLNPSNQIPDDATYFAYLVKDPSSDFRLDTQEAMAFQRKADFLVALNDNLTSEILDENPRCDEPVSMGLGTPYNNGKTDGRTWVTWRDGDHWYLKVHVPSCGPKILEIELEAAAENGSDPTGAKVTLDGSPVTEPSIARDNTGGLDLWLLLPERIVPGQPITISIAYAGGAENMAFESFSFMTETP